MTATQQRMVSYLEIVAQTGDTDGAHLLEKVKEELGAWGGMSHSDGVVDDDGSVSVSFDPDLVNGGPAAILNWLNERGWVYSATFHRWVAEV